MKYEVRNFDNTKVGEVTLNPDIFSSPLRQDILARMVHWQLAKRRSGTHSTKGVSQISGTTKKPWRQKGTGRARAGMSSSPLWRGGGRIFPNSPEENFSQKVNRKMYRAGMASILSRLVSEGAITIVPDFVVDAPKTKQVAQQLKSFGFNDRVLIVTDSMDDNLWLASRNLVEVLVIEARQVDPVSLVRYDRVVMTQAAVKIVEEMFV